MKKKKTKNLIPKLNKKREELCLLPVLQVVNGINGMQSDKGGHSRSVHSQPPEINTRMEEEYMQSR